MSKFFRLGLSRLIAWGLIVGLVILVFNVIGYQLISHEFTIFAEPRTWPNSYLGRVLLLAFVGFAQCAVWLVAVGLVALALVLGYYGILYLGGYRNQKDNKPKV